MDIHCFHLHESTISQFVFKVNKKILTTLSKNDILISTKAKEGGIQVTVQKAEDVKDTALKLDEIRTQRPEDYFYLKGWIHCLLQKAELADNRQRNPTKQLV